jgi:hypothetical protein
VKIGSGAEVGGDLRKGRSAADAAGTARKTASAALDKSAALVMIEIPVLRSAKGDAEDWLKQSAARPYESILSG